MKIEGLYKQELNGLVVCDYFVSKGDIEYGYGICRSCNIKVCFDAAGCMGTICASEWNEKERYYGTQHSRERCYKRQTGKTPINEFDWNTNKNNESTR